MADTDLAESLNARTDLSSRVALVTGASSGIGERGRTRSRCSWRHVAVTARRCDRLDAFARALFGKANVSVYDSSLMEWTADPDLPMTNPSQG